MDDLVWPKVVRVFIKQSKKGPFRKITYMFLGRTQSDICPVKALVNYLVVRGKSKAHIMFSNGDFLTRQW